MTKLSEVTEADLGQWIAGATTYNPVEFNVHIVDLAVSHGFELDYDTWASDKPKFLAGEAEYDMIEDLGYVSDQAIAWMNQQLPDWFYFDFLEGLHLCKDSEVE